MISRIVMNGVACFKAPNSLEIDRPVTLVYGLNGTGKSTISNFLYDSSVKEFSGCSVINDSDSEVLVYNQKFISDYFHQSDDLPGIFTLSKENVDAERKIDKAEKSITELQSTVQEKQDSIYTIENQIAEKKRQVQGRVWEIKTLYSGGDHVLEFCLTSLKGSKDTLFNYLYEIDKPFTEPDTSIESLKEEAESLQRDAGSPKTELPRLEISVQEIEENSLFKTPITGNEKSAVAGLIQHLQNSDWIKQGLDYIPDEAQHTPAKCPFCQQNTITEELLNSLRDYFDESYNGPQNLNQLLSYIRGVKNRFKN